MVITSTPGLLKIVNPIGQCRVEPVPLARRLDSLSGKSVGFINTGKPNVEHFLAQVEDMIRADYSEVQILIVRKDFSAAQPIAHELEGKVQAVVNAWAD